MSADRELVEAVLARRAGAFERLVRDYQGLVAHIVFRIVRHSDDMDELCQDVFLRIHRQLHQFRFDSTLKAWIGRVAYTIALRHLEKRPLRAEALEAAGDIFIADEAGDVEAGCVAHEVAAAVRAAVSALPSPQRLIVSLYHLEEISIPEIAAITGLAAGTIKSHLFRTRQALRGALEKQLGGVP